MFFAVQACAQRNNLYTVVRFTKRTSHGNLIPFSIECAMTQFWPKSGNLLGISGNDFPLLINSYQEIPKCCLICICFLEPQQPSCEQKESWPEAETQKLAVSRHGHWKNHSFDYMVLYFYLIIYLCLSVLGLCCYVWAFSSCSYQDAFPCVPWTSHCGGLSCCQAQALGAWALVLGFSTWA